MQIFKINPERPERKLIKQAAEIIKKNGVVVYPTDTVYGMGVNALNEKAIKKLFVVKERPKNKPFSIIVKDVKMVKKFACVDFRIEKKLAKLLPGPITVILFKKEILSRAQNFLMRGLPDILTSGTGLIGIRVPDYKITRLLSAALNIPFTATSANISGRSASGRIKEVVRQFQNKKNQPDLILDAGDLPESEPSTVVDLTSRRSKILRSGPADNLLKKII